MIRNYNDLGGCRDTILKNRSVKELDVSPTAFASKNEKPSMYLGWLVAFLVMFGLGANAQVSSYVFSQSSGTYTPITGGTNFPSTSASTATALDDAGLAAAPIGFSFTYDGLPYTTFGFNTNGWITLGSAAITNSYVSLSGGTNNNVISAFNADLICRQNFTVSRTTGSAVLTVTAGNINNVVVGSTLQGTGIPVNATVISKTATTLTMSANATATSAAGALRVFEADYGVRYETIGVSPNRKLVVQFTGFSRFATSGSSGDLMKFQIVLSETSNLIEVIYNNVAPTSATAITLQVGLRGASAASFNNRSSATDWAATIAGVANTATVSYSNTVTPASGLTFTWTPPPPPACTLPGGITFTQLSTTSTSVSWTAAPSAVVEWGPSGCVAGTGAAAGACGNVLLSGSSPQTITGLVPGTVYSVHVRQDCTGSANGYSLNNTVSFTAPLAGESCVFADFITVAPNLGAAVNTLLTTGASSDGPAGTCSDGTGNPSKKDRWVKFVAPSSGNKIIIATTAGTITDMIMQVWSACPATGTALGCSDDANATLMPELQFCQNQYTAGATYWVQIWPYSATATGNYNIRIYEATACPLPPPNNECATIQTLTIGAVGSCPGAAVSGTTVNATASPGILKTTCDPFGTYLDVFYKFNSGSTLDVNFQFTNLTGVNEFGIYSACGTGYLNVCNSTSLTTTLFGLTPNTDYFIVVWANPGSEGTFTFCLEQNPLPACVVAPTAPTNGSTTVDTCNDVILSWPSVAFATSYDVFLNAGAGPAVTNVSLSNATTSFNAGLLSPATAYSWRVVPKNGTGSAIGCSDFTFTTTAVSLPTCITAPINPVSAGTICAGPTTFSWPASATTYTVIIDGITVSTAQTGTTFTQTMAPGAHTWQVIPTNCVGTATGCVNLTFTSNGGPAGDLFAGAIDLGVVTSTASVNGNLLFANCWQNDYTSASTPGAANARPGNDVFYKFEITCPGTLDFGTCTSDFDTFVHLLNAAGTQIDFDDDTCITPDNETGSFQAAVPVTAGIYYIVVEGYDALEEGTFTLDLSTTPTAPCSSVVNLTMFVEGYYVSPSSMNSVKLNQWDGVTPPVAPAADEVEDITVELHDSASPYGVLHTTTATLKTDGTAIATFTSAPSGSFYIAIKTSNAIQTWSANPQTVGASPLSYNFSTAAAQAYNGNMIETIDTGVWALYSGDLNQDEVIDGTDAPQLTNDVENSAFGVQVTDINGDGAVDGSDVPFFDNNSANSIFANYPF